MKQLIFSLFLLTSFSANASLSLFQDEQPQPFSFSWTNRITSSVNIDNEILSFETEDTIFFDNSIFSNENNLNGFLVKINDLFNSRIETIFGQIESYSLQKNKDVQKPVPLPPALVLLFSAYIGLLVFKSPIDI